MSIWKSGYYDRPEGEDYIGKMAYTNKIAFGVALGCGKKFHEFCFF